MGESHREGSHCPPEALGESGMWRALAQSVQAGGLALSRSCRPRQEAAWFFSFHPQRYQARWLVFGLVCLQGGRPEPPGEAVERIEAADAGMVRRMMVMMMAR